MQTENNQNQTSSEAASQEPSDERLQEFEKSIKFLSDLPTERAMKELAKMRAPESVKKVVETMALSKMDLVKSLRLMNIRERALEIAINKYKEKMKPFEDLTEFLNTHEDYDISVTKK